MSDHLHPPSSSRFALPPLPPAEVLTALSAESQTALARLLAHRPPPSASFGLIRTAAVLVALFQPPRSPHLHVLLTTRAKTLRKHPSQTALPGGQVDPEDEGPVHAALREAEEEVGLPMGREGVWMLAQLEPVLTVLPLNAHLKGHIVVTPVVVFISDPDIVEQCRPSPDEVDYIFSHPLRALLDGRPEAADADALAERDGEWWPHPEEFYSMEDRTGVTGGYRMHRFRTTHTPIKGITSDVLLDTAVIAYDRQPSRGRLAPHQPPFSTMIAEVVRDLPDALKQVPTGPPKPLVWGGLTPGVETPSGETWHTRA